MVCVFFWVQLQELCGICLTVALLQQCLRHEQLRRLLRPARVDELERLVSRFAAPRLCTPALDTSAAPPSQYSSSPLQRHSMPPPSRGCCEWHLLQGLAQRLRIHVSSDHCWRRRPDSKRLRPALGCHSEEAIRASNALHGASSAASGRQRSHVRPPAWSHSRASLRSVLPFPTSVVAAPAITFCCKSDP